MLKCQRRAGGGKERPGGVCTQLGGQDKQQTNVKMVKWCVLTLFAISGLASSSEDSGWPAAPLVAGETSAVVGELQLQWRVLVRSASHLRGALRHTRRYISEIGMMQARLLIT